MKLPVCVVIKQVPVKAALMIPLDPLPELAAHEQKLLARMPAHVAVQRSKVCKLLPDVSRHLVQQRSLAVDDFIVRERQDEVLTECVHQAESQFALMILSIKRISLEVLERVVHPAHVPFEIKAEPSVGNRPRDQWPRG